jgi:predicted component of type VI protein secretion system
MDLITANMLESQITLLIKQFEPRCNLQMVEVSPNFDLNQYDINIRFYVVGTPGPITYSTFLKRAR